MAAVEAGNTETAQRMVDEAAERAQKEKAASDGGQNPRRRDCKPGSIAKLSAGDSSEAHREAKTVSDGGQNPRRRGHKPRSIAKHVAAGKELLRNSFGGFSAK